MYSLQLKFSEFDINIQTDSKDLLDVLVKDFSYFEVKINENEKILNFEFFQRSFSVDFSHKNKQRKTKKNCTVYQEKMKRLFDYDDRGVVIEDLKEHKITVYSPLMVDLHELCYLAILSYVGKEFDRRGIHRVHACSILHRQKHITVMMSMHVGKTTLMLELLKQTGGILLSDDSPLINQNGDLIPFPLRIGLEHLENEHLFEDHYKIQRKKYGMKYLIPVSNFMTPPHGEVYPEGVFIIGKRSKNNVLKLKKIHLGTKLYHLSIHMIIGFGLPMIKEYFLLWTLSGFWTNVRIFFSRLRLGLYLSFSRKMYEFEMSSDVEKNATFLLERLDQQ